MRIKTSKQSAGGIARAEKLSPQERSEIAKKAAEVRWGIPRATHEGLLQIGAIEISCAVLADGTRVLTQSGVMKALGRARQAKGRKYYDGDVNLPAFLTAKNLKPFIPEDLLVTSSQIEFRTIKGAKAFGYSAELLPQVCEVFLDAESAGVLVPGQRHIAEQAKILVRGLARLGIVGLVDEATGYQEVRDRNALQAILDKYLRTEFAAWAKRFPDEFYKEMFRLKGWSYNPLSVARPGVVGHYTTDVVYERLAPGIVEELERMNPKNERGNRRARHHQWLTDDIGHPALSQHLHAALGLMRASNTWGDFMTLLDRAFPKKGTTIPLLLE